MYGLLNVHVFPGHPKALVLTFLALSHPVYNFIIVCFIETQTSGEHPQV